MVVFAPFVPAVLLWEHGRVEYRIVRLQTAVFAGLKACIDNNDLDPQLTKDFKKQFAQYYEVGTNGCYSLS